MLLLTPRLLIREFQPGDVAAVHEYASNREVVRFMPWGPNSQEETAWFVRDAIEKQKVEPRVDYEMAVTLRNGEGAGDESGGRLIGACGLGITNPLKREATLGYCYHPAWWGKGCATEAAAAMLEYGFRELNLHRIWAGCDVENFGSARVLEKIGMRREAHLLEDDLIRGEWRSSYLYAILQREWSRVTG